MADINAFFDAIIEGDLDRVRAGIAEGADVNGICTKEPNEGATPLTMALLSNNATSPEIIEDLVKAGAQKDIVVSPELGFTLLHHAANLGIPRGLMALLRVGCNPNILDVVGRTPVHYAGMKADEFCTKFLILGGADPTITAKVDGHTPATYAAMEGGIEIGDKLLQLEYDYTANKALFAFFSAIFHGDQAGFEAGITAGFANTASTTGWTPLIVACQANWPDFVERLLTAGADVNARAGGNGYSPLGSVLEFGHTDLFEKLIAKGANVNNVDAIGNNELVNALIVDAELWTIRRLIELGVDVNAKNSYGESPLYIAAKVSNAEVIQALLEGKADPKSLTNDGATPLHSAARTDTPEIIKVLIDAGVPIDGAMNDGWQPIHVSAEAGNLETLKKFIELGADKNATTAEGKTPLDIATEFGFEELVAFLGE